MTDWLLWLEQSALPTWVRESGSVWGYPTVLTLHTLGLAVLVGASAVVNLRVFGFARQFPVASLLSLMPAILAGLTVNGLTGLLLFAADATTKAAQPVFYLKLGCIALALLATVRLMRLVRLVRQSPDDGALVLAGARRWAGASLGLWAAAITAGRLMAYQ